MLDIMCNVLNSSFPFSDRHGYGCYPGTYQVFYADPEVEENVQNVKSWGKDWNLSGLKINGKQILYP